MMLNRGKKDKKGIIAVCVFLCMLIGAVAVYASSPGSDADPVVTKSYVDSAVKNAISGASGSSNTQVSAGGYLSLIHI